MVQGAVDQHSPSAVPANGSIVLGGFNSIGGIQKTTRFHWAGTKLQARGARSPAKGGQCMAAHVTKRNRVEKEDRLDSSAKGK